MSFILIESKIGMSFILIESKIDIFLFNIHYVFYYTL